MLSHRPASALLPSAPVRVIGVVTAWLDGVAHGAWRCGRLRGWVGPGREARAVSTQQSHQPSGWWEEGMRDRLSAGLGEPRGCVSPAGEAHLHPKAGSPRQRPGPSPTALSTRAAARHGSLLSIPVTLDALWPRCLWGGARDGRSSSHCRTHKGSRLPQPRAGLL